MRLTKIYTKVGDKGQTMLASGEKVPKSHVRIDAYGTVDELNSIAGSLRDELREELAGGSAEKLSYVYDRLETIQQELFDVGGELATPSDVLDVTKQQVVTGDDIERLEQEIDAMNEALPPLKNFVLPGGHKLNSVAHICRTVCRRSEREIVKLRETETIRDEVQMYVNRLSDWFFVASRYLSKILEVEEILWNQKRR